MPLFTLLFLLALGAGLLLEVWLLVRHRRRVAACRDEVPHAFADRVTLEEHRKAADYTQARVRLGLAELLFGALVLLAWTLGGGLDLLAGLWAADGDGGLLRGVGLVASFLLIGGLIDLPFSLWRTFVLEQRFGFNHTTPRRFALDTLLQLAVGAVIGLPLVALVLWLMGNAGAHWWLIAWVAWVAFSLFVSWLYPTLIAPLFNRFTPLEAGELRTRVEGLLDRCGFSSKGIFVMDGSRRTGHGNAYFTGLGRNKRIVFYDTLIDTLSPDETEAVLAHELGHFKRRHVRKRLALAAGAAFLGLALLGWLAGQAWFYQGLGVSRPSAATALLLFMLAVPVFAQFLTPLAAWYSRRHEFEADAFAAGITGPEPMITALVKLYRENASTLTPDPLYSAFHDSHPPAPVRVAHLSTMSPG